MKPVINIFWFRRDLRWHDNVGLYHALKADCPVLPIFIFDTEIIDPLPKNDARVTFIFDTLQKLSSVAEQKYHSGIALFYGATSTVFSQLESLYTIQTVFTNHDYEPYAINRDCELARVLKEKNIGFKSFKDQVIFEKDEVVKSNGQPYLVYTPYMKSWKAKFKQTPLTSFASEQLLNKLMTLPERPQLRLEDMGFTRTIQAVEDYNINLALIKNYASTRNFPEKAGTSRLGPHLRFGTVSIRNIMQRAVSAKNETFWQELIWREFFMQILWHFPQTLTRSFKPKYDGIKWRNNPLEFKAWCAGKTGYPLVDAGMRELNKTGYMHNRVRMLTASFLCKHLLVDWRWGEAYFAKKLHDYDLASNLGNWQWVAGCGVDAAPYFRIFNPLLQAKKFDKNNEYIKKWVPEYQDPSYPSPIVAHAYARERCLETFKQALLQE